MWLTVGALVLGTLVGALGAWGAAADTPGPTTRPAPDASDVLTTVDGTGTVDRGTRGRPPVHDLREGGVLS